MFKLRRATGADTGHTSPNRGAGASRPATLVSVAKVTWRPKVLGPRGMKKGFLTLSTLLEEIRLPCSGDFVKRLKAPGEVKA